MKEERKQEGETDEEMSTQDKSEKEVGDEDQMLTEPRNENKKEKKKTDQKIPT